MTRERRCQMLNHSLIPTTAMCMSMMPREKNIMKCYAGKCLHAEAKPINIGDTFLVKQPQLNKLSTPFNPTPLVVTERKGTMVTALRGDGSKVTRNFYISRSIRKRWSKRGILVMKAARTSYPQERDEEIAIHSPQLSIFRLMQTVRPPRV